MSREQMGSERLADYFVNYLFASYQGARHVRRVASWVDLVAWIIPKDVLSLCFSTPGIT